MAPGAPRVGYTVPGVSIAVYRAARRAWCHHQRHDNLLPAIALTITSKLGRSGMGEVYGAVDKKFGRDAALNTP
jgi:hypothetical protein